MFPLAKGLEVCTAVFQLTVTVFDAPEQLSTEGIVMVSTLEVSDEFLFVRLRFKFVTVKVKGLVARSWRFDAE